MRREKRYLPLLILGMGIFLIVAGFICDVMFAGIPSQDPTPEMAARYARHVWIASTICTIGGGAFEPEPVHSFRDWLRLMFLGRQ